MFKKEMNERIIFLLNDYFGFNGFKLKKTNEVIYFLKKINNNFERISITSSSYYDNHYLSFAYGKRVGDIEKLMVELEKQFEPNFFYLKNDNPTYTFSPLRLLNDKNERIIKEENDIVDAVSIIKNFTDDYAYAQFDFLDNLYRVDKTINGNGENFWYDDDKKKIGMNRFDVRRIVIAKLAKSSEEYKRFVDKLMAIEDIRIEEIRQSDEKYKDLKNWFVPKIVTHLDEIVK